MAKRFRFNLEKILKLRRQVEDRCRRAVARRLREIDEGQRSASQVQRQIVHEFDQAQRMRQAQRLDLSLISRHRFWISRLQGELLECQGRLRQLRNQLEKDRGALLEASKEVRVLEQLREGAYRRYLKEQARAENAEMDDLATQWYLRQQQRM